MPKKLYVCGDSYFSCDEKWPGSHFSEIIADKLDLTLVSLARQGISNSAVRLQIERALSDKADFVIFGATDSHRFEIPLHALWSKLPRKAFDINKGLDNIEYRYYPNPSHRHVDASAACLWSDHYSKYSSEDFDPQFRHTWKVFFSEIYDRSWRDQQDRWIIESSLARLENANLPFVFMPNENWIPVWCDTRNLLSLSLDQYGRTYPADTAFHTTVDAQHLIADVLIPEFEARWFQA